MTDKRGTQSHVPGHFASREIGSLRALSNGESQYVGSSSGVYFINTVRRAFSTAVETAAENERHGDGANNGQRNVEELYENPSPEDCIVGREDEAGQNASAHEATTPGPREPNVTLETDGQHRNLSATPEFIDSMKGLPDYAVARRLVLTYFRIWHPLVPFLQGPVCFKELDALYANQSGKQSLSRLVIFRCIFNVAALDTDDANDLGSLKIRSASDLLAVLGLVSLRCDIASIQGLLSAQVYFIATMALRNASSVGGLISKAIVQSGMHRCPFRYWHLSPDDRLMRKRIFWSAYVLDRFLSQSLGHPNGIQDSDIDVCPPGSRDFHEPVPESALSPSSAAADNTILHLPSNHPERRAASPRLNRRSRDSSTEPKDAGENGGGSRLPDTPQTKSAAIQQHRRETQAVLENHVRYSQLIGRMLETFHKSINVRGVEDRTVLFLKADVASWGNNLLPPRLGEHVLQNVPELNPDPTVFPFISYQYAVLVINRPSLSLDPESAEFQGAMQICIAAANTILQTIGNYSEAGGPLFWPGYMSAVWMSGLVLAFAAQLRLYNLTRAIMGIESSLKLLVAMTKRWHMAGHCREVLAMVLGRLEAGGRERKRNRQEGNVSVSSSGLQKPYQQPVDDRRPSKRRDIGLRIHDSRISNNSCSRFSQAPPINTDSHSRPDSGFSQPVRGGGTGYRLNAPRFDWRYPRSWMQNGPTPTHDTSYPRSTPEGFYDHQQGSQPGQGFDVVSQETLDCPHVPPFSSRFLTPIPTTFPDRRRNQRDPDMGQMEDSDAIFDIFDGATWGSLIDLVDDTGNYF